VVAAPALRRLGWIGAAVVAAAVLLALALHGRRPDPAMVRFEAAGVMIQTPPAAVRRVVVSAGEHRRAFVRDGAGPWLPDGAAAGDPGDRIERGLRFLHVSAPQRVLTREEVAAVPAAEFGLDPPRYRVAVEAAGAEPFTVEFGGLNAQGLAQYARVVGREDVVLLPRFVGEPWEALVR
jgi:hypothetical protein